MTSHTYCPATRISGHQKIALLAVLDDPGTPVSRCAQLTGFLLSKPMTTRQVREHRNGACDCPRLALASLVSPGDTSPDPTRDGHHIAPKGWEPGVRYDAAGVPEEITAAPVLAATQDEATALAIANGLPAGVVPAGYRLVLKQANFDPAAWHRDEPGDDAVTRAIWRLRFGVVPDVEAQEQESLDDLIATVRTHKPAKRPAPTEDGTGVAYAVVYGDLQLGKCDDAGGSEETVARILAKTDAAVDRLRELRKAGRPIDQITIPIMGDCVEGFASQNGRLAFRQDLSPTQQIRVYREVLLHIAKTFAPLADRVVIPVVPGNHDDAQRQLATYQNDDFATEGASAVAMAIRENPAYEHVSFVFAQHDRSTVTLDVCGTIVGLAHGHQIRMTGKDGAMTWWAQQAHGLQPIGEATLLLTAHFHHLRVLQPGRKTWLQIPALDNGSRWFTEKTGAEAPAGLVTLTIGHGSWDDLRVL